MPGDFVHLHLHSQFSLLDGANRLKDLIKQVGKQGMPAVAVTEHGNMFSSVIFHDQARKRGINPILGCEVFILEQEFLIDQPGDVRQQPSPFVVWHEEHPS